MYVVPKYHRNRWNGSRDTLLVKYGAHDMGDLTSLSQVI